MPLLSPSPFLSSVLPSPYSSPALLPPPPRSFFSPSSSISSSASTSHSSRFPASLCTRGGGRKAPFCSLSDAPMEGTPLLQQTVTPDFLSYARAYWVARYLIAWNVSDNESSVYLYASSKASLFLSDEGIQGYDVKIQLETEHCGLPASVTHKFPHIANYKAFKLPSSVDAESLLKCQLAVASFYANGKCMDTTGLQIPGVLDDIFAYSGPLGAIFCGEAITLHLWAPTAQEVNVCFYEDPLGGDLLQRVKLDEVNGVWSAIGSRSWEGLYYVYEVSVYHPSILRIETCTVVDPYARGLSSNGTRTWLVDLDSENLKPSGWDNLADEKPELLSFSDISIYELHIRDFSANDPSVDLDSRGGYLAFTSKDSFGVCHLKKLSNAGLTHVHLLPSFHFAGVDDDKNNWKYLDDVELAKLPPDSDKQQAEVMAIQDEDGYNWGYNPVIWGVPKGSYSSNPNGPNRILESRKMVQALNQMGLRVVLDVVYNHLAASGPFDENSVLDKVVPGYFLRRNTDGGIENSAVMNNTASEHFMVERLILDDLKCWAVDYKVDGFRFDLMGHIMKRTMVKAKMVLQSLSKDEVGVDGSKIYIYGEGWDFGEVAKNKRGINASQFNIAGTGIGSFNDRIRDAVLGGSPFGHPLQQGFVTGQYSEPNGYDQGDKSVMDCMLSSYADHIQAH
ncbi:pullulanase 1, chloroplastic isoform X2 [Canna indica]|uniref:Pullulanase 1, chloroplastic isoform X2 n=1 Tax=Canna indica TaxID=4628 RepID=A0AAQ3QCG8_9LILI|nr:pullulanase 1, chloroplastic isoform X2 [Canna indica]